MTSKRKRQEEAKGETGEYEAVELDDEAVGHVSKTCGQKAGGGISERSGRGSTENVKGGGGEEGGDPEEECDLLENRDIYRLQKRSVMRRDGSKWEIYIGRAARLEGVVRRVIGLLDGGRKGSCVRVYGMGAAILTCCRVGLEVQRRCGGGVETRVETRTVEVYDEYEPLVEGYAEVTRIRRKSGISISLRRGNDYV
eukprot:GFKZ01016043.1.p1 GENE.GFKZ01016043.1~~GFKZ01016043.1.p1  ORF type:complete len:197 (-),score=31.39 GFKZ01016043.1:410-1000(-)